MTDRTGQQLGNYRLLRLLGRGGFADVYLGEHVHLNTLAAIKVLDTHLSSEGRDQFLNEARTIAHLEHPNIVRVLDFGVVDAVPFLVMSYAPNGSLRQQHPSGTRLPPATIIAYVKQLASALDYAHAQKVMHRDVKPENMLLGRNHEVLLSDFGLAMGTYSSSQERARDASGTIAYMAPEQARGKPRPASDQYALAVAVYEWLCGSRPFEGTYEEIAVQHVLHDPPSLCRLTPEISLEVEAAVLKALAKDPHQRFDTVQEFAGALELAHQSGTQPGELKSALPAGGTARHETTSSHDRTQTPAIYAVAWSADRRQIVAGGHDRVVRVRNLMNGLISLIYRGHAAGISALAWSLDGQRIASASLDKTIQVWDAASGEKIASYKGHTGMIHSVAWSPDGKWIASASSGDQDKTVHIWDASMGTHVFTYHAHNYWARAVAWSPDGKYLASGSLKEVQVWQPVGGQKVSSFRGHGGWVRVIAWSPDGKRIASTGEDKLVQVWEVAKGRLISTHRGQSERVSGIAWSPDGKSIAVISTDALVQVWDVDRHSPSSSHSSQGSSFTYHAHASSVHALVWLPDGKHIAAADGDGSVQVWQVV
jgi:serine/threonine protein kinase